MPVWVAKVRAHFQGPFRLKHRVNVIFPHLLATVVLKKYAPGLLTGMLLNLPFSIIIIYWHLQNAIKVIYLIAAIVIVGILVLSSLKYLFRIGKKLIA